MKLRKIQFKQILKLHLLKYKTYEQSLKKSHSNLITDLTLNQVITDFKKILQVIFQYHTQNKKILFIGLPQNLESKVNKETQHVAISKSFNVQGLISNTSSTGLMSVKQESKQNLSNFRLLLPKLANKTDLVVVLSHEKKEAVLKECFIAKIPVINFEAGDNAKNCWSIYSYKLQLNNSNLSLAHNKNLLFIGLNFIFKITKVSEKSSSLNQTDIFKKSYEIKNT